MSCRVSHRFSIVVSGDRSSGFPILFSLKCPDWLGALDISVRYIADSTFFSSSVTSSWSSANSSHVRIALGVRYAEIMRADFGKYGQIWSMIFVAVGFSLTWLSTNELRLLCASLGAAGSELALPGA